MLRLSIFIVSFIWLTLSVSCQCRFIPDPPLIEAAIKQDINSVRLLLDSGYEVNEKNQFGDTALTKAAGSGNIEIVKLLVARGADVNAANKSGRTALIHASMDDYTAVV